MRAPSLDNLLHEQAHKDTLRFITCGSVDDGKSTLIGRMLFDSQLLLEDQIAALERESALIGRAEDELDFSLLVDGLQSEREQGITIDVAYRYFETPKRKFIVADAPGHEQYTRNMVTGASTAALAVVLVDARKGVSTQTRRHSLIVSLMGIRHVILAVNKMDLLDYDGIRFEEIRADYLKLAARLGLSDVQCIPISALKGANVSKRHEAMPWYTGPVLLENLENIRIDTDQDDVFRFPVQWVNRPHLDFRGFSGTVAGGTVSVGDEIQVLPGERTSRVARIATFDGDLQSARQGDAVTLVLADELDVSRGSVLVHANSNGRAMALADKAQAHVVWMDERPLIAGRSYRAQLGPLVANASVMRLKHTIDVNSGEAHSAREVGFNEVAVVEIEFDRPVPFDTYAANRTTGAFVLIDRLDNATVAAGMIDYPLRRATNVVWHQMSVDAVARASIKRQQPRCIWFTGLSGSGKSTMANLLDRRLHAEGLHTYILDADNVRHGLNKDLGFTENDRVENIRRMAEVAKLMVDAGLVVMVCAISPFRRDRQMARELFEAGQFIEVFMDTPLEVCESRDPKGLYKKARAGLIPNFTGISSPYERPETEAEVVLSEGEGPGEAVSILFDRLFVVDR